MYCIPEEIHFVIKHTAKFHRFPIYKKFIKIPYLKFLISSLICPCFFFFFFGDF